MFLYFCLVGSLLGIGLLARITEASWVSPTSVLALLWAFYLGAVVIVAPDFSLLVPAVFWIVSAILIFYLGELLGRTTLSLTTARRVTDGSPRQAGAGWAGLSWIVPVLALVGLFDLLVILLQSGVTLQGLSSAKTIVGAVVANRSAYIYGSAQQTLGQRFVFFLLYFGALVSGVAFPMTKSTLVRVSSVMVFILVCLVPGIYGSRDGVLFGGSFWLAAFIAASVWKREVGRSGAALLFKFGAVAGIGILGLSFGVEFLRYHTEDVPLLHILGDPFAYVLAFAHWFRDTDWWSRHLLFGFRTFQRLFQLLGSRLSPVPSIGVGFTTSNVYTVFQALIDDWGLVGTYVIILGTGVVSGAAFRNVRLAHTPYVAVLTTVYALVLTSFSVSTFSYNGPMAALLTFAGVSTALAWRSEALGAADSVQGRV